jgi:hypothetical protein
MAGLSWAIWLAAPVAATLLAALVLWWRGLPKRPLRTAQTISGHQAYLQALMPAVSVAVSIDETASEVSAEETQNSPG